MRNEGEEDVVQQSNSHSDALEDAAIVYRDVKPKEPVLGSNRHKRNPDTAPI
jgi:hypothetical protein